jgi:transcriptional antiterminator RfaH
MDQEKLDQEKLDQEELGQQKLDQEELDQEELDQEKTCGDRRWYAIRTHPKQEERADSNLRAWNVETFSPKVRKRRNNPYVQMPVYESKPLFPRYIFARFDAGCLLRKVLFTRGVQTVVNFGGVPAFVKDEIITLIQSQVAEDGFIGIGESLKVGDQVMIEDGPLRNLVGIFEREVKGTDRVLILLEAISFQGSVLIERERISRVATCEVAA